MAKTQTKSAPKLADLYLDSQAKAIALAELEAKQAAEREALAAEAKSAEEAAQAAMDELTAPYRAERDAIILAQAEAVASRNEATAPVIATFEEKMAKLKEKFEKDLHEAKDHFDAVIAEGEAALTALETRVFEETGVPAVLFNADIAPKHAPKATGSKSGTGKSSRKSPKVADLGVIPATNITAPKRYPSLDPTNPVTVRYEVSDIDGTLVLFAKRIDKVVDGAHVISADAMDGAYTHQSTVASEVTTTPGWHSTKDVMFALLSVAGKTSDWTEFGPDSDASDILVNGEPLATTKVADKATILKETV